VAAPEKSIESSPPPLPHPIRDAVREVVVMMKNKEARMEIPEMRTL
jgi:hypothetical protein